MNQNLSVRLLSIEDINLLLPIAQQLNPHISKIRQLQQEMFTFSNYVCFGLFINDQLIGISSGWITIRHYSGKQLEVDNVVIDSQQQSKGFGKFFFDFIEQWAIENGCKSVELNSYVQSSKTHKFYFNQGYKILGFHFQKEVLK